MSFAEQYMASAKFEFRRYKTYGDQTFQQLSEEEVFWSASETDNSIAIIVKHMSGNMLSRWTSFLIADGEKEWRRRDQEFTEPPSTKNEMLKLWEKGWDCLFTALDSINPKNFDQKIKIRNEEHAISEAINRQLAHYTSHVGQIVFLGKMIKKSQFDNSIL